VPTAVNKLSVCRLLYLTSAFPERM